MDSRRIVYNPRPDATPGTEISALVAVFVYLIKTHNNKRAAERVAASDDRDVSTKIRTQGKEATMT